MKSFLFSLVLLACAVLLEAQEEGEGETDNCFRPLLSQYNDIFEEVFESKLGNATLYVNCMAFGETGELQTAIVSGRNESGGTQVLQFVCEDNDLEVTDSSRPYSDVTANSTCVECSDRAEEDVCSMLCDPMCERCYGTSDHCTQCVAAMVDKVLNKEHIECRPDGQCPPNKTPNPDNHNICECTYVLDYPLETVENELDKRLGTVAEEEEIEEIIKANGVCAEECVEKTFEPTFHNGSSICYACGIRFCMKCEEDEETGDKECTKCLSGSLFDSKEGECLAGRRGEELEEALEQEREEERDRERAKENTRLALAISLSIIGVLAVVFIIVMVLIVMTFITRKMRRKEEAQKTESAQLQPSSSEPVKDQPQPDNK